MSFDIDKEVNSRINISQCHRALTPFLSLMVGDYFLNGASCRELVFGTYNGFVNSIREIKTLPKKQKKLLIEYGSDQSKKFFEENDVVVKFYISASYSHNAGPQYNKKVEEFLVELRRIWDLTWKTLKFVMSPKDIKIIKKYFKCVIPDKVSKVYLDSPVQSLPDVKVDSVRSRLIRLNVIGHPSGNLSGNTMRFNNHVIQFSDDNVGNSRYKIVDTEETITNLINENKIGVCGLASTVYNIFELNLSKIPLDHYLIYNLIGIVRNMFFITFVGFADLSMYSSTSGQGNGIRNLSEFGSFTNVRSYLVAICNKIGRRFIQFFNMDYPGMMVEELGHMMEKGKIFRHMTQKKYSLPFGSTSNIGTIRAANKFKKFSTLSK